MRGRSCEQRENNITIAFPTPPPGIQGGGNCRDGSFSLREISCFRLVRNFPHHFQAAVRNKLVWNSPKLLVVRLPLPFVDGVWLHSVDTKPLVIDHLVVAQLSLFCHQELTTTLQESAATLQELTAGHQPSRNQQQPSRSQQQATRNSQQLPGIKSYNDVHGQVALRPTAPAKRW